VKESLGDGNYEKTRIYSAESMLARHVSFGKKKANIGQVVPA